MQLTIAGRRKSAVKCEPAFTHEKNLAAMAVETKKVWTIGPWCTSFPWGSRREICSLPGSNVRASKASDGHRSPDRAGTVSRRNDYPYIRDPRLQH